MKNFILFLSLFVFVASASAEEIALSNGMTIKGSIIERTDKKVRVSASGMEVTYYMDEILSIDGKPTVISSEPVERKSVTPTAPAEPQTVPGLPKEEDLTGAVQEQKALPTQIEDASLSTVKMSNSTLQVGGSTNTFQASSSRSVKSKKMTTAQVISVVMIALAVFGFIFVLACYPVFLIAKKTNTASAYFAFIPILNYYLLCKIAGRPVWWMVLYFIPLVGLVIDVIVWMDIAKVRQKPNWLGALILVPLANLGMMWYLAITDQ